jgi:hypothetical protein
MVVVAVTLGFFIGGGPSLLSQRGEGDGAVAASADTTTTIAAETTTTAPPVETTTTVVARPPGEVSVRVYNGSTKGGKAIRVGERVKAAGYQLLPPGPSPSEPLARSVVHFVAGYAAEGAALALALGLPARAAELMPDPPLVTGAAPAQLVLICADDLAVSA